ncbi:MAG: hypothetical protein ACC667_08655 [Longimicrobiales bacterium]
MALTLFEVIRHQDLPSEVLEEEDPSVTMPRKLGLSDVVEARIRHAREDVKRGQRITDDEFHDLVRLVIRRPDSEEVFRLIGVRLSGGNGAPPLKRWRFVPSSLRYAVARRAVMRSLKSLFGRRVGGFASGPFTIEGRSLLFIQSDPGGDACALVSGLCGPVLQRTLGIRTSVSHVACEARGDAVCRWELSETGGG